VLHPFWHACYTGAPQRHLQHTTWPVGSRSYRICLLASVAPKGHTRHQKLSTTLTTRLNSMTNIFIDVPILLEHRSQIVKGVFLGYHLTIESSIPLLLRGRAEIILHILYFIPSKPKTFYLQSQSPQFQLLVNPHPTLIHQNHIIRKKRASRDTTLHASCDLIHH
jgi:hypothetical protein